MKTLHAPELVDLREPRFVVTDSGIHIGRAYVPKPCRHIASAGTVYRPPSSPRWIYAACALLVLLAVAARFA